MTLTPNKLQENTATVQTGTIVFTRDTGTWGNGGDSDGSGGSDGSTP